MRTVSVAKKYARALFESSQAQQSTARIAEELAGLVALTLEDDAYLQFMHSPEVLTESKHAFLNEAFAPRLDELLTNFLRLLVDKGRINLIEEIGEAYRDLVEESQGIVRAWAEVAVPLDSDQEARLKAGLDRMTGKKVLLETRIEPSILGGVVVHLGNTIIDRSLRRGLWRMRERLRQVSVQ